MIIFITYRIKEKLSIRNTDTSSLFWWISILSLFFSVLDTQFPILGRFCLYFNIVVFALFLYYVDQIRNYKTRKIILVSVVCFLMLRIWVVLEFKPEWYHLEPYTFYDFSIKLHDTQFGY